MAAQQEGSKAPIPDILADAELCRRMHWTWQDLRQAPHYFVEQLWFLYHIDNEIDKAESRDLNKGKRGK